jgi:hypothetical protein
VFYNSSFPKSVFEGIFGTRWWGELGLKEDFVMGGAYLSGNAEKISF